ncbi:MAG: MMPL family transporter, partial [Prevotella sp.]|nr:MMPL family transporter [Prevotella sp.]
MARVILKIYDYMRVHTKIGILSFLVCTVLLVLLVLRVEYKEDISDFLPLGDTHDEELKVYQSISGADKIFAVFQYADTAKTDIDKITQAIDYFVENVSETDTIHIIKNITAQVDLDVVAEATDFIYSNIPYFLTETDYQQIDSVLRREDFIPEQLTQDKNMLMFPSGGLLAGNIQRDPLNLFTSVVESLLQNTSDLSYEMYDGYIFSPDMKKAIVMMDSPFGASETENNTKLVNMLKRCATTTMSEYADTEIHLIGGPVIAVGNAKQIKADSVLSISIAMLLILAFLFAAFRNIRNLLLITVSIGWGWLFGFGCLSLVHHNISVIVLGISSVVIGIAVNYPLHLIAHLSHTTDKRAAVREIVAPLLVGNITTVGAFLALVPLQSVAMRDLGLFSSFLLIGTIIFVLLYLPHVAKSEQKATHSIFSKLGDITLENKPYVMWIVVLLTLVFGYYSFQTKYDANMANINYMTDEQKADMEYFQNMMKGEMSVKKIYVISSGGNIDEALDKSMLAQATFDQLKEQGNIENINTCSRFLCSEEEQARRLSLWNDFVERERNIIETSIRERGNKLGFQEDSFDQFFGILGGKYKEKPFSYFQPLTQSVFSGYISERKNGGYNIV